MGDTITRELRKAPTTDAVQAKIKAIYDIVEVDDLKVSVNPSAQTDVFELSSAKKQGALYGWKAIHIQFATQVVRNMYYQTDRRVLVEIADNRKKSK